MSRRLQFVLFFLVGGALGLLLLWWSSSRQISSTLSKKGAPPARTGQPQDSSSPSQRASRTQNASEEVRLAWVEEADVGGGNESSQSTRPVSSSSSPSPGEEPSSSKSESNESENNTGESNVVSKEAYVEGTAGTGKLGFYLSIDEAGQALGLDGIGVYLLNQKSSSGIGSLEPIGEWTSPGQFHRREAAYFRAYYRTDAGIHLAPVRLGPDLRASAREVLGRWRESFRGYAVFRPETVRGLRAQVYEHARRQGHAPTSVARAVVTIGPDEGLRVSRVVIPSSGRSQSGRSQSGRGQPERNEPERSQPEGNRPDG